MRGGLSTIQQTLTPEASTVLNHSIAEAGRRNHGQTTPLHVASTLLSSPTGFLRQACIRSHPNSSHPLQSRALELCFSVALERLPTSTSSPAVTEPPISNALMAALKRAQAHQRRGCPEQQQQPLLAVKVELEQLIISILDDPSVSRVMREASFSSPAVKATIEQSLSSGNNQSTSSIGIGFSNPSPIPVPVNRNLYMNQRLQNSYNETSGSKNVYLNPRLQENKETVGSNNIYLNPRLQGSQNLNPLGYHRNDDVKKVIEIMTKQKKRNPILVGDFEPEPIRKEILKRIETGEFELKDVEVISLEKEIVSLSDKSAIPLKIKELGDVIDKRIGGMDNSERFVIDLGDLKWLVEQPPVASVSSVGRESVSEMSKIVLKFGEKVWLIGTATCETYLRCQVYHPSMETDWDVRAVPITARSPTSNMFTRMGTNGILGSSTELHNPLKNFSTAMTMPSKGSCCPKCTSECEQEVAKLKDLEKPPEEVKSSLPQWMQNAKQKDQSQDKDQEIVMKQKVEELQKKWKDNCLRVHPNNTQSPRLDKIVPMAVPLTGGYKPNMLLTQSLPGQQPPRLQPPRSLQEALQPAQQPRLQPPRTLQEALQPAQQPRLQPPRTLQEALQPAQQPRLQPPRTLQQALQPAQQPRLEPPRSPVGTDLVLGPKKTFENEDLTVKDLLGCISSEPLKAKFANSADTDSFKKLLKGLMKKAWWQPEAASTIATTITQCKVDSGSRGCVWLLFVGPDRVGKKKMCSVLAEHVSGTNPITISLGSRRDGEETDMGFRGKTVLDRIVEAVRRNPSSVIVLLDIDEADMLVRGSIKRAMERGRITDSHGREISLGNVVFVLTGNWSTASSDEHRVDEQRLHSLASHDWQLRLTASENRKRRAHWLSGKDRSRKPRLDLNLSMDYEEDRNDGSLNSSNLTIDQEDENQHFAVMSVPHELVGPSDGTVVFKPVNIRNIRREIEKTIKTTFSTIVEEKITIEVEEGAIENILGGLWFGRTSLEEWAQQVLIPSFQQFNARVPSPGEDMVIRLELDRDSVQVRGGGDWLPSKIGVVVDGVQV